jgi:hypothetical protein
MVSKGIGIFLNYERSWCIIKLGPLCSPELIDNYYKQGFRQFHCSNTLPCERGGKSGHVLKPYNEKIIQHIKKNYDDIINYEKMGANHYGFSSVLFHPIKFLKLYLNIIMNS